MNEDEIILMADASGLSWYGMGKDREKFIYYLEAFAALVTAAEREAAQPKQETQCKWPTCQNEEYQNTLAEQLKQELVTGRPWVGLTEKDWEYVKDSKGTSLDTFDHGAAWAADQLMKRNT